MNENYNQMNINQAPMGGPTPMPGQMPMGGPAPMPGQMPMGGPAPMPGQYPMGGPAPMPGQMPMGGPAPMPGQYPMGGPAPMPGQTPMMNPNPYVAAPPVPFQGLENKEHIKTQDEVQNDPKIEKHVKDVMASPFTLAFAIIVTVQIVCMIVTAIMKIGIVTVGLVIPYALMAIAAWIIWGTAKKGKPSNGATVLIKVQCILNIVSMGGWISFFLFICLMWAVVAQEMAELVDELLNMITGIHFSFQTFGQGSGLVFFLAGIVPMILYIILQAKMIGTSNILSNSIKQKIDKKPKTMFTAVLMFIFAVLSGLVAGIYIFMLSKALITVAFIIYALMLVLNVALYAVLGIEMLMLRHEHDDDWY